VAIISIFTAMMAIMAFCIRSFVDRGVHIDHLPDFKPQNLPIFFAVMTFSMEGIALVLPVKNSMQDQTKGSRFIFIITISVQLLYLMFGIICSLAMGRLTDQIIFHNFGTHYVLIFVIEIIYSTSIFLSYPLNFFPVYMILHRMKFAISYINRAAREDRGKRIWHVKLMSKAFCMIIIFAICFASPNFLPFLGLSGALFNSMLGFFLPAFLYWRHFNNEGRLGICEKIFVASYVVVCFVVCVMGIIHSIQEMFAG